MSHAYDVLELLENISPSGRCDDCLSEELDIRPRQTINIVCRPLHTAGKIERFKATCAMCGKVKLVNTLVSPSKYGTIGTSTNKIPTASDLSPTPASVLDVEKIRTTIVHICKSLWQETKTEEWPRSLAVVINQLRRDGVVPNHQANLMLTLSNLRNVHVYEDIELGASEMSVAIGASQVVSKWWQSRLPTAKQ